MTPATSPSSPGSAPSTTRPARPRAAPAGGSAGRRRSGRLAGRGAVVPRAPLLQIDAADRLLTPARRRLVRRAQVRHAVSAGAAMGGRLASYWRPPLPCHRCGRSRCSRPLIGRRTALESRGRIARRRPQHCAAAVACAAHDIGSGGSSIRQRLHHARGRAIAMVSTVGQQPGHRHTHGCITVAASADVALQTPVGR
jgi:hypothetical protein